MEKNTYGKRKRKSISKIVVPIILVLVLVCLSLSIFVIFQVNNIEYVGSVHYNEEELTEAIFRGKQPNALLYYLFDKNDSVTIPFIQKIDVEIEWPNKMNITVYEKPIVGYVYYMGSNMYFDKDSVVVESVESSTKALSGIPLVSGLDFKSIVLNSKLDVGDPKVFTKILELTQSFDKYELVVDKIYFSGIKEITVYMGSIKVLLGNGDNLMDKLFELKQISPELVGRKGTLDFKNYTKDSTSVILKQEK